MSSISESSSSSSLKQFGHVNIMSLLRTQSVCALCLHSMQTLHRSDGKSPTEQTQQTFVRSSFSSDSFCRLVDGFTTLFRDALGAIFAAAATTFAGKLARVARGVIFAGLAVDFAGTLARLAFASLAFTSLTDFLAAAAVCSSRNVAITGEDVNISDRRFLRPRFDSFRGAAFGNGRIDSSVEFKRSEIRFFACFLHPVIQCIPFNTMQFSRFSERHFIAEH